MRDVNKVILMGRLGADPVLRETKSGVPVANFSLATSRRTKPEAADGGESGVEKASEPAEETQWHKIVVWGRQGEVCSHHLRKGHSVYIEGSVRSRKYETQEGESRFAYEIHADEVNFISRPRLGLGPTSERVIEAAVAS